VEQASLQATEAFDYRTARMQFFKTVDYPLDAYLTPWDGAC
jgi:hypothetical protein